MIQKLVVLSQEGFLQLGKRHIVNLPWCIMICFTIKIIFLCGKKEEIEGIVRMARLNG